MMAFFTLTDDAELMSVYFGEYRQGPFILICSCFQVSFGTSMFYIIGLGLCDEKDITLRGLEACTFYFIGICAQPWTRLCMALLEYI